MARSNGSLPGLIVLVPHVTSSSDVYQGLGSSEQDKFVTSLPDSAYQIHTLCENPR